MKKVVLFDIDGTLIEKEEYPKNFNQIKEEIHFLKREKIELGICTYRPMDNNVKKIIKDYELNGPIITEGGACLFQKGIFQYHRRAFNTEQNGNLNKWIKSVILDYWKCKKVKENVMISTNMKQKEKIILNGNRIKSATIRFPNALEEQVDSMVQWLKESQKLKEMKITRSNNDRLKVTVFPKDINKIDAIETYLKNTNVIFITDFEEVIPPHNANIKVYSVGKNNEFNSKCNEVFSTFGKGVEEILKRIRSKL